jgi:hypothetical protein
MRKNLLQEIKRIQEITYKGMIINEDLDSLFNKTKNKIDVDHKADLITPNVQDLFLKVEPTVSASLYVRVRAETGEISPSSSAHAIVKSLSRDGFKVVSISEITRTPRGGPKKSGGRRGRRV